MLNDLLSRVAPGRFDRLLTAAKADTLIDPGDEEARYAAGYNPRRQADPPDALPSRDFCHRKPLWAHSKTVLEYGMLGHDAALLKTVVVVCHLAKRR